MAHGTWAVGFLFLACSLGTGGCAPLNDREATPEPPPSVAGCGPHNCNGCCTAGGQCQEGGSDEVCGLGGVACVSCTASGGTCQGGTCQNSAGCGPGTCGGCCEGTACVTGLLDGQCGTGGAACGGCKMGSRCEVSGTGGVCAKAAAAESTKGADGGLPKNRDSGIGTGTGTGTGTSPSPTPTPTPPNACPVRGCSSECFIQNNRAVEQCVGTGGLWKANECGATYGSKRYRLGLDGRCYGCTGSGWSVAATQGSCPDGLTDTKWTVHAVDASVNPTVWKDEDGSSPDLYVACDEWGDNGAHPVTDRYYASWDVAKGQLTSLPPFRLKLPVGITSLLAGTHCRVVDDNGFKWHKEVGTCFVKPSAASLVDGQLLTLSGSQCPNSVTKGAPVNFLRLRFKLVTQ
ncbi:MAG: hypothetical protein IT371_10805 [Deltaproteobacteria bacterium]|nr:hypothetical protein [Deltaproteobacteria bacterium]